MDQAAAINQSFYSLFDEFRNNILSIDPVYFCEKNLTLDGKPFQLNGNGYKPFADIYRYVALKAIQPDAKKVVLVKGRQVGATTMAAALEMYFMTCGLFGTNQRSPMRVMHLFPTLSLAAAFTKDKLDAIMSAAVPVPGAFKSNGMLKSFIENKLDTTSPSNDNQHYKKFIGGNLIWIESTGLDGDRVRGRQLCLETDVPTPTGFVKLKDLKEGDKVFDEKGDICNVTKVHPINITPEAYRITFDDGLTVDACAEHLWLTHTFEDRLSIKNGEKPKATIKNTKEILNTFELNHSIPNSLLKEYNQKERFIKSIESIPTKPMRCITVDSPSHLYLITKSFLPTHNTVDAALFDECFPYDQNIETDSGKIKIGKIYDLYTKNKQLPLVKTYNEQTDTFEYKKITKAWKRQERELVELTCCGDIKIKCTEDHSFLTINGWQPVSKLQIDSLIKSDKKTYIKVTNITKLVEKEFVYDIGVEDNHNFIVKTNESENGLIAHNCQDMSDIAIGAVTKILAQSKYGPKGEGVQVYFGTPKSKGGAYWKMWQKSSQNYFHLRCEKCGGYFPLYRPDINWEDVWIYGMTVRCTHCKHEQDKNPAAERGKWIALNKDEDCEFVGYHINQLYIPTFTKEVIERQKPERSATNTERIYMNEVLGEFFDGDGSTISIEEIYKNCSDMNRDMAKVIPPGKKKVYVGFDWGQRAMLDQASGRRQGRSYSCAIILTTNYPGIFEVEFATRLMKNDPEEKMNVVEEMYRRYAINLGVGDIGDAFDLTHKLQRKYGDVFLASRTAHRINGHIKFQEDIFPKEILFEKDYYISEMIGMLKEGKIRFPIKAGERINWLIKHCASMDTKITRDKSGEPVKKYVKGDGPNDGLMALLNAYLAWKFDVTQGFKIKSPNQMQYSKATTGKTIGAVLGYMPQMSGTGNNMNLNQ